MASSDVFRTNSSVGPKDLAVRAVPTLPLHESFGVGDVLPYIARIPRGFPGSTVADAP